MLRVNDPACLDENALDTLVRVLCDRELAMNTETPDIRIPRAFPGGGSFCLQEFVSPSDDHLLIVRFQRGALALSTSSSDIREEGGEACESPGTSIEDEQTHLHRGRYSFSTCRTLQRCKQRPSPSFDSAVVPDSLQARLRQLVQRVLSHFHVFFELQVVDITLEFAHDTSRDCVYLVGAKSINGRSVTRSKPKRGKPERHRGQIVLRNRSNQSDTTTAPRASEPQTLFLQHQAIPSHTNFRVCRHCRNPQDVDLANELALKQTTMRRVLAKLQSAQEERTAAEQRDNEAHETLQQLRHTLTLLQRDVALAHSSVEAADARVLVLTQENAALQLQAADAVKEARVATTQLQGLLHAERLHQSVEDHTSDRSQQQHQHQQDLEHWDAQYTQLQTHVSQLELELERSQHTLRKLQTRFEKVRASRDELRFQWRFVRRKLVDVHESGVAPPQRIAGGYRSIPTPSDANVRDVVQWIVDYDAKRAVVDAHKSHTPVKKRLQLKLELMRLLGSPTKRSDSGRTRLMSPLRKSRSPSKRSPAPKTPNAASSDPSIAPSSSSKRAMTLLAEAAERTTVRTLEAVDTQ